MGVFSKFKTTSGAPEYLIVGLGNPGDKYTLTRHNVGFLFIDRLADRMNIKVNKLKFKGLYGDGMVGGVRCLLLKPQTFMNLSGESVGEITKFYKIPPQNVIVAFDDVSLNIGELRIRKKGSAGGHNGIKSIIAHLSSEDFPRIKIAIGPKTHPQMDLADFVLGRITGEDEVKLADAIDRAVDAVALMVQGKTDQAMNKFN
ncbi:MAG: aminoacyl-tRNA hydrolase [Clostridia bacterium]|nr:aminoacyl-tRNA hydrolase [Clostridia bacterium]